MLVALKGCIDCLGEHEPPRCGWPRKAPCYICGRLIGMPGYQQPDDRRCNRCWHAMDLGITLPEPRPPMPAPPVDPDDPLVWLAEP